MACGTILKNMKDRMFRVKELPSYESLEKTGLAKVLGVVDLLSLGIGSTIGVGIYVIAGQVARLYCGPSIFISFLIAGIASLLAGMCYAEFAARVPRAGSAYVYSYVTVGEFMAFIIGWTLVLEHAIGSAAITRAGSAYIDSVTGNKMSQFFRTYMPIDISIFASYPDLFAFSIDFVLTLLLIIGVKESSRFNCIFTSINISMVLFTIGFFLSKADIKNWQTETKDIPKSAHAGTGGFFPYGVDGMLTGAAVTFYTYVGFDTVATAGEETKNPKRDIPLSIILTITIVAVIYILMSMSLTLVTPYYKIDPVVSVPLIFDSMGWYIPKYFVYAGAFCGLATSLVGALFPLPRILYAMGLDDVLFPFFATISERFKTPAIATLIGGTLTGLIATMFSVEELISMYSIGTLQSYALVSVCVIILRYRQQNTDGKLENEQFHLKYLFMPVSDKPTAVTEKIVKIVITLMCMYKIIVLYTSNTKQIYSIFISTYI
ncbi:hypothetical protein LOTGIDRAFT_170631 [Lottia gigantea]|uniref:Cationic amino acid transporter C-terminal domain-containing protein n=1 Tax=Lottia gigantea TaxID=225164 RepID=V4AK16_LOTGI|nr:hypothetical protein LOTGIDRAFT_170631 [Lottia gigantea]ESP04539.1 hypothetical protein LOTGIDRAFT_170631 [Lottia gigantea]